nr:MAG TPA: hypothetical protein [Caudoviricetes sp.]
MAVKFSVRSFAAASSRSISASKYSLCLPSVTALPPTNSPRLFPAPALSEWRGGRLVRSCPSLCRTVCLPHTPPFWPASAG